MRARDRILETARDALLEEGPFTLSPEGVARRAGIDPEEVRKAFADRDALLLAVATAAFDRLDLHLGRGLEGDSPEDRLAGLARGYLAFALQHPRDYALAFLLPRPPEASGWGEVVESRARRTLRFWVDRVREAMHSGWLAPGDPREVALTLSALAHGLVAHWMGGGPPSDPDDFARFFWRAGSRVMEGLGGEAFSAERIPALVLPEG